MTRSPGAVSRYVLRIPFPSVGPGPSLHGLRRGCYTPLFARFNGTMTESESSNTYIAGYEHSFFPSRPGLCVLGMLGGFPGPLGGRTHVHGFLDAAEPVRPHEYGRLSVAFDHGDGLGTPKVSYFVAH